MSYDKLIVSTGADPRILPFPGKDLGNIFAMRGVADTNQIETAVASIQDRKPNVVIVGSSFIGMEAASVLAKSSNVTVIGMEKVPCTYQSYHSNAFWVLSLVRPCSNSTNKME